MSTGVIKFWTAERGFGFIVPDDGGPDVFVHAKNLDGCSELFPSQAVEFEAVFDHARGKSHAVNVRVVG
jgi:CspA family cold shock protein